MTPETRALETAARVVTTAPAHRGICDHCNGAIRGTLTTVTLRHVGRDVTAQVCPACCKAYVTPGPLAADAAARARFHDTLIAYRSVVPLPATDGDLMAATREAARQTAALARPARTRR